MSRYVTVRVTQEDIDAGRRKSGTSCPIARAVRRAGYPNASIEQNLWWPSGNLVELCQVMPAGAARFIGLFDDGEPVQPATFRLPLP